MSKIDCIYPPVYDKCTGKQQIPEQQFCILQEILQRFLQQTFRQVLTQVRSRVQGT